MRNTRHFPSVNYTSHSLSSPDTNQEKSISSSQDSLVLPRCLSDGQTKLSYEASPAVFMWKPIIQYHDDFVMRVLWPIFMILHPF